MHFTENELLIPSHWLSAIVNGDETSFDYYDDPQDYAAFQAFCEGEIPPMAIVSPIEDEGNFYWRHDATGYGVLACDCVRCAVLTPVTETEGE